MGGVKKKPLSAIEKAQRRREEEEKRKRKGAAATTAKAKEQTQVDLSLSDDEIIKQIAPLKAVTIYSVARMFNIKASVANQIIRSLVEKGKLEKVGGFSGHYVYKVVGA